MLGIIAREVDNTSFSPVTIVDRCACSNDSNAVNSRMTVCHLNVIKHGMFIFQYIALNWESSI